MIKTTQSVQKLWMVILLYITFQSSTIFNKPNRYLILFFGVTFIIAIFTKRQQHKTARINFVHVTSVIVLAFSLLNVICSEIMSKSFYFWCTMFGTICIIFVEWDIKVINWYMKWIERLVFIFCLTIYMNWIIKDLMTNILSFLVISEGSLRVLNTEILDGQFSGILAERSCAAVAASLGLGIMVCKCMSFSKHKIRNYLGIVYYTLALILTGKRIPILVAGAAIVLILLLAKYPHKGIKIPLIAIAGYILINVIINYFPPVKAIFERTETLVGNNMLMNGRDVLWSLAFEMYERKPIYGTGLNSFNTMFNQLGVWGNSWGSHAHNTYIQLLGETGIVGLVLFCVLFLSALFKTMKLAISKKISMYNDIRYIALFAFFVEIFWIGYGFSGNPFYYLEQRVMYFIVLSFVFCMERELNKREGQIE